MAAPSMDLYYSDKNKYFYELAKSQYEGGDTGATFIDPTYGLLKYADVLTPGTTAYRLKNPGAIQATDTGVKQAQDIFKQQTGVDLGPTGLDTITKHIRQGDSVQQALANLGDLNNYVKFHTDYHPTGVNPADVAMGGFIGGTTGEQSIPGRNTGVTPNSRLTTPEFASQFQQQNGRAPTQEELLNYINTKSPSSTLTDKSPVRTETNTVKGYDTNNNYAEVWVPAGKYVPGVSATPKGITPESMASASNLNVPGASAGGLNQASAMVQGASTNLNEIIKQLTPVTTETGKKEQSLLDQMTSLIGEQGNKAADQLTAEQSAGLPQLRQQFADINAQILAKAAEYNVLQTENQNKPITMNSIIGNERAILNAKAADIGLLQARAQGLQGQIETAQNTANRAIDLKYSTIEARLNTYQAQLNALQPTLNKEEKIRAQAQQVLIDNQKQALNDFKQSEKNQTNYLLDLMGKYPDAKINLTDSITVAQNKINSSRIYQDQVRAPISAGGGSTIGGANQINPAKLSAEAQAVISGTLRLEDLTPTTRGKIAGELTAAGYQSGPKLSAGQQESIATMGTVSNLIDQIMSFNNDGRLEGIGAFGLGSLKTGLAQLGLGSDEGQQVRVLIGNIKGTIAKLRGGTSFTPNEEKLLDSYTPSINDSPGVALNKLSLLKDFIAKSKTNLLGAATERQVTQMANTIEDAKSKYGISY